MIKPAERHFHRVLGTFLLSLANKNGLEGIVIRRKDIVSFLGMRTLRDARLKAILKDIEDIFPHNEVLYERCSGLFYNSGASVWLGLKEFKLPDGMMFNVDRASLLLESSGLRFGILDTYDDDIDLSFDLVLAYQQAVSLGQEPEIEFKVFLPQKRPLPMTASA